MSKVRHCRGASGAAVMRRLVRWAAALLALSFAATPVRAETVRIGQLDVSFYAVTRAVVAEVLDRMGHDVTLTVGRHAEIYRALGDGEIDLMVNAWLPHAHGHFREVWEENASEIATLYEGAALIWAVPGYVPADAVSSVADLGEPAVRDRMRPVIQGIGPSSGIMTRSAEMMRAYGLTEAGYVLREGDPADRKAALAEAVADRQWVVVPLGTPMFLNPAYDLRTLAEPKNILGAANRGVLLAHDGLAGRLPEADIAVLASISLGRAAVEAMDVMVNVDGLTPEAAAAAWMAENPEAVASWLGDAR